MATDLHRSVHQPIREGLSWSERWEGKDKGLIWCWERGRQKRAKEPELAACAEKGELVMLVWKGGVDKKPKTKWKPGTFQYLATWQGLRGDNLDVPLEAERVINCTKTGVAVLFSARIPEDEE